MVYDAGPKTVRCPVLFLPPASGTADVFFKQILTLSSIGYRVMSVSYLFNFFFKLNSDQAYLGKIPAALKTPLFCAISTKKSGTLEFFCNRSTIFIQKKRKV